MIKTALSAFALSAALAAAPAIATPLPPGGVQVPSARLVHIRNFYAPSDSTLYVRAQGQNWYKAELAKPCFGLPTAERIKVNMKDGYTLDSNAIVQAHGERCQVASVYRVDGPDRHLLDKPI